QRPEHPLAEDLRGRGALLSRASQRGTGRDHAHDRRFRRRLRRACHPSVMAVPEGWSEGDDALQREVRFADFGAGMDLVNRVAEVAEEANHHPDIAISYNRVTLRWWTHTAGGVTDRDRELAERSGALA